MFEQRRCFNDEEEARRLQEEELRRLQEELNQEEEERERQAKARIITSEEVLRFRVTKEDLEDSNWRSPSQEALNGRLQFHVREAKGVLFLCSAMTDIRRGQEYEVKFVSTVEAIKCVPTFTRRHHERFDATRHTSASVLLMRVDLEKVKRTYGNHDPFHFEVKSISLCPVEWRPPSEERSLVIRSAFTSVGGMEVGDKENSAPFFWRGWKAQVMGTRGPESLGVFISLLRDLDQPSLSCRVKWTVTLQAHGEAVSKTATGAFSSEASGWGWTAFLPWEDVVDPSRGWLTDGRLSVTASIEILDSVGSCAVM
ncbi:unnamed protein product [Cyprideis torosa]|uniref:Uncharacterized protein n=1 Tax=Cyprideis torosa TaxID=163714 RepID=A0A7R8ZS04_9CRUS|nr:unnamed protein product [Cyprideis torosa]CAG0905812.1 unnamed protein product [Cyprideis torosa]